MSNVKHSIEEIIGHTPMLELEQYEKNRGLDTHILLKLENQNPLGSLKDRVAMAMIDALEANTDIQPGDYIVESSSGNTAIALAAIGRKRGYKVIVFVEQATKERLDLLAAYGAEAIEANTIPELVEGKMHLHDGYGLKELISEYLEKNFHRGRYFFTAQWANDANRLIHYNTTAREIWEDTDGKIDVFIDGVGSGGSIRGITDYLKEQNPDIEVIAFDPPADDVDGLVGIHKLIDMPNYALPPLITAKKLYDKAVTVQREDAYRTSNAIAKEEGIFFGITTGAAVYLATELSKKSEYAGKTFVMFAYDDVMKYLSTDLVNAKYRD